MHILESIGLTPPEYMGLRDKIQRFVEFVCRNLGIQPIRVEVPKPEVFEQFTDYPQAKAVYKSDLCFLPSPTEPLKCVGPTILFNPEEKITATTIAHEIIHHKDKAYFEKRLEEHLEVLPFHLAIVAMEMEVDSRARKLVREKGLAAAWERIKKDPPNISF